MMTARFVFATTLSVPFGNNRITFSRRYISGGSFSYTFNEFRKQLQKPSTRETERTGTIEEEQFTSKWPLVIASLADVTIPRLRAKLRFKLTREINVKARGRSRPSKGLWREKESDLVDQGV